MRHSNLTFFIEAKQYRTNWLYAESAKSLFARLTTGTDSRNTLRANRFFDRLVSPRAVRRFLETRVRRSRRIELALAQGETCQRFSFAGAAWEAHLLCQQDESTGHHDLRATFTVTSGQADNVSLGLGVTVSGWLGDDFICVPGSVYGANRVKQIKMVYPPFLPSEYWREDVPIITTEIPGLSQTRSRSKMNLLAGEMATPSVGLWDRENDRSTWLLTEQRSAWGNNGITIAEDQDERSLSCSVMTPCVRENVCFIGSSTVPSWDSGARAKAGDEASLRLNIYADDCRAFVPDFYEQYSRIRRDLCGEPDLTEHQLPFSAAWKLHEEDYNNRKWSEEHGYWHAGFPPNIVPAEHWMAGWGGGLLVSYAMLCKGSELSARRALRNLAFFFSEGGQSEKGIFYAQSDGKRWGGDDFIVNNPPLGSTDWIYVWRCGDYLYNAIKHFTLLGKRGQGHLVKREWKEAIKRCADALCTIWDRNGQLGQYINPNTLEIHIGNSVAASLIPAALTVIADYYDDPKYLHHAERMLQSMYERFCQEGYTHGGALETLCTPDGGTGTNLVESLVAVYEATGDETWLTRAHDFGYYAISWFYGYDFGFPEGSTHGKLGTRTTGSLLTSPQNRCSTPNIYVLSGDMFWKLYRYTQNPIFMKTIQECVHNAQQYVSRPDRPITTLRGGALGTGSIHECIQTGEWSGPTGEIPYDFPDSWPESVNMASIAELPGIYVIRDRAEMFVLDHVDVTMTRRPDQSIALAIHNPTRFDAEVSVYAETSEEMSRVLGMHAMRDCPTVTVPSGAEVVHELEWAADSEVAPIRCSGP